MEIGMYGKPCGHLLAVLMDEKGIGEVLNYFEPRYFRVSYMKAYAQGINAALPKEQWTQDTAQPVAVPHLKHPRGPAQKKRMESKPRAVRPCKYAGCVNPIGHDKRSCPSRQLDEVHAAVVVDEDQWLP
jgi:hypothetical protein